MASAFAFLISSLNFFGATSVSQISVSMASTLTEELLALAIRIAPMQQKTLRLRRYAPLARRQLAPLVDFDANRVDESVAGGLFLKRQFALSRTASSRRRNGNDLNALAATGQLLAGRLPFLVQFEMPLRLLERRVDDRIVGKSHYFPEGRP